MALAGPTLLATFRSNNSGAVAHGTGALTGSITTVNNSLAVVAVSALADVSSTQVSTNLSVSGGSLTWTKRAQYQLNPSADTEFAVQIWTAPVTTGATFNLTIDCGSVSVYSYDCHAYYYTGYDTGSPTGGIAQFGENPGSGAISGTLGSAPASTSSVLAAIHLGTESMSVTHGTGWTELNDTFGTDSFHKLQTQHRTGSTSTSVGWDSATSSFGPSVCCAVEIKEASSSSITATSEFTEPNETLTGAAVVAVAGVATFTEPNETLTGIGSVAVVGSAEFTEANETLSSAVEVRWYGVAEFTEPNEALTSAVAVAVRADLNSPTEAAEALTSAVTVAVVGVATFTEPGETLSSDVTVTGGAITADAAFTEANEALTSAAVVIVDGELTNAEPNEALTSVGTVAVVATAAFTEPNEALSSAVTGSLQVNAAFTEPNEALTSAVAVAVDAQLAGIEATDALTSAVAVGVTGSASFTEPNESLTSAGLVVIVGTGLNNTEANEQLGSLVDTGTGFVYGTHRRISIGIGMGL